LPATVNGALSFADTAAREWIVNPARL